MHSTTTRLLGGAATLGLMAGAASAQAAFQKFSPSGASRMTPDGQTVVGYDNNGGWLWTSSGGFVPIGGEVAVDLSDDASVVGGNLTDGAGVDGPAIWDAVNGWQTLGGLPGQTPPGGSHGTTYAVSGDGSIVVGLGWHSDWKARGFRWDAVNGMVELPQSGPNSSRASAISGDGLWIGGFDEASNGSRRAALWDANLNQTLPLVRAENPDGYGEINDINSDGTVFCGSDSYGIVQPSGFVWSQNKGLIRFGQMPGQDPDLTYTFANATSEDGEVVVGGMWDLLGNTTFATIWTEATGQVFLSDYLEGLGVTGLDTIQLANAIDVSADGTTLIGWGVEFPFTFVWWQATIPACGGGTASFCVTSANSAGPGALIESNGHVSVSVNDFQMSASGLPVGSLGLFYYGAQSQQVPFGNGFSCVTGSSFRVLPPFQADPTGAAAQGLDFTQLPAGGQIVPGSTWYFQAWYRDPAAGGATFNLSDGLMATFCD
jgi:uncharacterized membrane protein